MRRKPLVIVIALVVVALAVVGGTALYASIRNANAPDELALSSQDSEAAAVSDQVEGEALAGTWTISEGSQAGYRVDEVLNGQDVTVVGRTSDVTGTVTVEGTELTAADVEVTMTTITTDSSNRDGKFLEILKTSEFPTATFTLTEPFDVAGLAEGRVTVDGVGDLTIAGVTRAVTVAFEAQTTGQGVEVTGSVPVAFADYGVDAPNLGFVKVEDAGTVEMLLTLTR